MTHFCVFPHVNGHKRANAVIINAAVVLAWALMYSILIENVILTILYYKIFAYINEYEQIQFQYVQISNTIRIDSKWLWMYEWMTSKCMKICFLDEIRRQCVCQYRYHIFQLLPKCASNYLTYSCRVVICICAWIWRAEFKNHQYWYNWALLTLT